MSISFTLVVASSSIIVFSISGTGGVLGWDGVYGISNLAKGNRAHT